MQNNKKRKLKLQINNYNNEQQSKDVDSIHQSKQNNKLEAKKCEKLQQLAQQNEQILQTKKPKIIVSIPSLQENNVQNNPFQEIEESLNKILKENETLLKRRWQDLLSENNTKNSQEKNEKCATNNTINSPY